MPARKKTAAKKSPAKTATLSNGDHVSWTTSQGETQGVVQKKLTSPMKIKTHQVSASPDNPEYLVKSDKSGDLAAHKPGSLHKTAKKATAKQSTAKTPATKKTGAKKAAAKKSTSKKSGAKKSRR